MKILNTNTDNIIVEDVYIPDNLRFSGREQIIKTYYYVFLFKQKTQNKKQLDLEITEHKYPNGYIYTTGKFKEKAQAVKLLNKAIDLGLNDARIISSKELNKIITGDNKIGNNVAEQDIANNSSSNNNDSSNSNSEKPNAKDDDLTPVYAIQLKALSKPIDLSLFKDVKGVKEYLGADGFYRYTYLEFSTREEATQKLAEIKEKGYNDAFVINVKRYKMRETQGNAEYTIQIKAMKTPLNMKYFNNLEGVKEIIANDGYYKYTYGKYSKLENAKKDLKKIKKKGYIDAFIVNVEKYH